MVKWKSSSWELIFIKSDVLQWSSQPMFRKHANRPINIVHGKCNPLVCFKMPTSKVVRFVNENNESVAFTVERILIWLQLFGIPIDSCYVRSKLLNYWSIAFGAASFVLNITVNVWALAMSMQPNTTEQWNNLIADVNFAFGMILVHAGLLISMALNGKKFIVITARIDQLDLFQQDDFRKFRKMCLWGKVAFVTLVSFRCIFKIRPMHRV